MLFIIGLGLGNLKDVTLNGLEAAKNSEEIFLEAYTSILCDSSLDEFSAFYGKEVKVVYRKFVEEDIEESLLSKAKSTNLSFLVAGDPFSATTHSDLLLRAYDLGVEVRVFHNASILTAVGSCGLSLYNFGRTTSIVAWQGDWKDENKVVSFYDVILSNRKHSLHTLALLDIKMKEISYSALINKGRVEYEPTYLMTAHDALSQLMFIARDRARQSDDPLHLSASSLCICACKLGSRDEKFVVGSIAQILNDFTSLPPPPHSLVFPAGKLHEIESNLLLKHSHSVEYLNDVISAHNSLYTTP